MKLIRAIRVCKTPSLSGHVFICKDCGHKHFVYHSRGHSHCMICQSISVNSGWISSAILYYKYHISIPFLRYLISSMDLLATMSLLCIHLSLRVAWLTVKSIMAKYCATPGMTSILHTFGSRHEVSYSYPRFGHLWRIMQSILRRCTHQPMEVSEIQ
ncbi:MAG: transposase zinc-binding domain-containing protein [Saprospiraceae bacterium]|nr:transposase zinc-binding domain-containing protein [Saprospiraceae bacterium]